MQEYVILKLCSLLWEKSDQIRVLIGMCNEHLKLKKHLYFVKSRPVYVPHSLKPDKTYGCEITGTSCSFCLSDWQPRTIFLDTTLNEGVWLWTVEVKWEGERSSGFWVGVAPSNLISECSKQWLGEFDGTYSLHTAFNSDWTLPLQLHGLKDLAQEEVDVIGKEELLQSKRYFTYPDPWVVKMEVNTGAGMLHFAINDRKLPGAISHIPFSHSRPWYIGASGGGFYSGACLTSLYLQRLPAATLHASSCAHYECRARTRDSL